MGDISDEMGLFQTDTGANSDRGGAISDNLVCHIIGTSVSTRMISASSREYCLDM